MSSIDSIGLSSMQTPKPNDLFSRNVSDEAIAALNKMVTVSFPMNTPQLSRRSTKA